MRRTPLRRTDREELGGEDMEEELLHVGGVEADYGERQILESIDQQQEWIREMKNRLRQWIINVNGISIYCIFI